MRPIDADKLPRTQLSRYLGNARKLDGIAIVLEKDIRDAPTLDFTAILRANENGPIKIPYYDVTIDVNGMPFCSSCKEADFDIDVSVLYGDGKCAEKIIVLQCRHLDQCAFLYEQIESRPRQD